MKEENNIEIYNETKIPTPNFNFLKLKKEILGEDFELSISVLLPENSKKINWKMRRQKYFPNTLSFLYTQKSGEIILTPEIIKKEMKDFGHTYEEHFLFLTIHSLLHLKTFDHGSEMEKLEQKYFKKFKNS